MSARHRGPAASNLLSRRARVYDQAVPAAPGRTQEEKEGSHDSARLPGVDAHLLANGRRFHAGALALAAACAVMLLLAGQGLSAQAGAASRQGQQTGQAGRPQQAGAAPEAATREPTRADILRGGWGPYRANNDLLFYHLDVRVDPDKKFISGRNTIRFRMLKDDTRIQIDLTPALNVDKIMYGSVPLRYEREFGAVFIDFPEALKKGRVYDIDFYYQAIPPGDRPFGGVRPVRNRLPAGTGSTPPGQPHRPKVWWAETMDQQRNESGEQSA